LKVNSCVLERNLSAVVGFQIVTWYWHRTWQ